MVFSSSAIMAKERFGDPNYFSFKQIISGTFGLAIMFIVMKVDYHTYRHPVIVFSTLAIVVAMLVVVFFLAASAKTHRWIQFSGFSMQPSEMAKLALIFFLAYFLEKRKGKLNDLPFTLVPIAIIVALLAGLILLQPDLGTAVGPRLSDDPIIAVGRFRGHHRARLHGGKTEAVLFATASYRFHFRCRRRRAGPHWNMHAARAICGVSLAWCPGISARAGPVRFLSRIGHHDDGMRPGLHQYECCPGPVTDQRDPIAFFELRRHFLCRDACCCGHPAKCVATIELIWS